jgi:hypothetical protein
MGTITQRKLADGSIRYRAEIRINRKDFRYIKKVKHLDRRKLQQIG